MADTLYGFGENEVRRMAEVDRRVLGNAPGVSIGEPKASDTLEPIAVQLSEMADPGSKSNAVLLDAQDNRIRDIQVQTVESIAWPVGRRGFCVLPQRYFAVLIENLPAATYAYATGTIAADSDQLTTSVDLSEYVDDYRVIVCGAGAAGTPLQTTIDSATSSIATLADNAITAVTDAEIGILAIADAWILERNECGRLVRKRVDGELVVRPIVNDFDDIPIEGDTLIGVEFQEGFWVPCKMNCDKTDWQWLEVSS